MRITKENEEMVLRVPLWQKWQDAIGQDMGQVMNLVGVVAAQEYCISQAIALGYKDDVQEGSPIVMFDTEEELREACKTLGLEIWEHPTCAYCKKAIRGMFGYGDKGNRCINCESNK